MPDSIKEIFQKTCFETSLDQIKRNNSQLDFYQCEDPEDFPMTYFLIFNNNLLKRGSATRRDVYKELFTFNLENNIYSNQEFVFTFLDKSYRLNTSSGQLDIDD